MKKLLVLGALALVFISVSTVMGVKRIQFNKSCAGFLERASNATTTETALAELKKATTYLENNNLTTGYTSVLWQTPDEDINFWYTNIKSAEKELEKVDSKTTALEKTNILMKLRETLIEKGDKSDHVSVPRGLSRYPNNLPLGLLWLLSLIPMIGLIVIWSKE